MMTLPIWPVEQSVCRMSCFHLRHLVQYIRYCCHGGVKFVIAIAFTAVFRLTLLSSTGESYLIRPGQLAGRRSVRVGTGQAQQESGDAGRALHPAEGGRQFSRVGCVLGM